MNILWHDAAVFELEESALYYGGIDDELGQRFTAAIEVAIAEIKVRPEMKRRFDGAARKARLKRFPYAVVYCLKGDT
ncbi:MAG: type II toxin-antitoxin system RelE/ParE family toxin, partial [Prosthecobacter sp.]